MSERVRERGKQREKIEVYMSKNANGAMYQMQIIIKLWTPLVIRNCGLLICAA